MDRESLLEEIAKLEKENDDMSARLNKLHYLTLSGEAAQDAFWDQYSNEHQGRCPPKEEEMAKKEKAKKAMVLGNLQYMGIDYDYNTYYACHGGSSCCDNDYCRCGVIEDARVTNIVAADKFVETHWNKNSDIEKYCIERILTNCRWYDSEYFEVQSCGGYYGEEIGGVYFNNANVCNLLIGDLLSLETDAQKVEFVLNLEYGHILDAVKDLDWSIEHISKDKIVFGQKDHYHKLDETVVKGYADYSFPRGICRKLDTHYRVVDGYHRLKAGGEVVEVLVGR